MGPSGVDNRGLLADHDAYVLAIEAGAISRRTILLSAAVAGLALVTGCSDSSGQEANPANPSSLPGVGRPSTEVSPTTEATHIMQTEGLRDPSAKRRALYIISTFESGTTEPKYGEANYNGDGHGIT